MKKNTISRLCPHMHSGGTPSTKNREYWDSGNIPWLTSSESGNDYINCASTYITQAGVDNSATKLAKKGSIIIATAGEGKTRAQVSFLNIDAYINQSLITMKADEKELLTHYLYYYLKNSYQRLRSLSDITGVRGSLSGELLGSFEISYPDIKTQKQVVEILSAIDEKIAINEDSIIKLNELTKTIYDYWFLQFEFPNEEGKPYKSSNGKMVWNEELKREIPEGWGVIKYKDIGITVTGKEDANFAKENGKYAYFTCGSSILRCNEYKFDGKALLIAGNGEFNVKYYDGKFNAYQRTYVLMPNKKYIGLLYQVVLREINYFKKGSNGSIVKFITKGDIENIEFLLPNDVNLLKPLNLYLDLIQQYNQQNQELILLRDFLLPLLMNGQVTFKGSST